MRYQGKLAALAASTLLLAIVASSSIVQASKPRALNAYGGCQAGDTVITHADGSYALIPSVTFNPDMASDGLLNCYGLPHRPLTIPVGTRIAYPHGILTAAQSRGLNPAQQWERLVHAHFVDPGIGHPVGLDHTTAGLTRVTYNIWGGV